MKNGFWWVTFLFLVGCSARYGQLPAILEDPTFSAYQEKQEALEGRYLRKELTYVQYLEEKKSLDDKYAHGVAHRRAVVENTEGRLP